MPMARREITLEDVRVAAKRISGLARVTPLKPSLVLSKLLDRPVYLKLENMQDTGAFKLRGAASMILALPDQARQRGVITVSSGNHGRAVAWVARHLEIPAVILLSRLVPQVKVEAIRSLGAEVIVGAEDQSQATVLAFELAEQRGLTYVDPFDHPDVIAGQGTIALEILAERPSVDTIVVPVGGGGLISGIGLAAHALQPTVRIVGVTNDRGPAMYECLKAGRIVRVDEPRTLADALPGAIPEDNKYSFALCSHHVEEILLVSEEQIAQAMAFALRREKLVLEGGGAAGLALMLDTRGRTMGHDVVVVCSGDNVDMARLLEIAQCHLHPEGPVRQDASTLRPDRTDRKQ